MTDPERFLSRWSRRKRTAADADPVTEQPAAPDADAPREEDVQSAQSEAAASEAKQEKQEKEEPAFDMSKLPSIDSITAETDIRAFLRPGVPAALTQAALRRAWVIDPKIRDFIEIAENQWDFTVTGGAPGFDLSPPTGDLAQMLKQILPRSEDESPAEPADPPADAQAKQPRADSTHSIVNAPPASGVEQDSNLEQNFVASREIAEVDKEDIALQKDDAVRDDEMRVRKRTHGGAMPR